MGAAGQGGRCGGGGALMRLWAPRWRRCRAWRCAACAF